MTHILNTSLLPVADRANAVRDVIAKTMVRVDVEFADSPSGPSAHGVITDVGSMRICSVRSNATHLDRTPQFARDSQTPTVVLGLQTAGSCLELSQDDHQCCLSPGQLAFVDSSAPFSLRDPGGIQQHFFGIKLASLALPQELVKGLRAVPLSPGHPVADLAATYLARLAARRDIVTHPGTDVLGQPSIELVRALMTAHLHDPTLARESLQSTLLLRLMEYIREHLGEPRLNAAQIAAAHHVSVRHLYNVLAKNEISLGDWIRTQRLEACRTDISRPEWRHRTIASLARQNGFADASTFGRLFRAAYGVSPSDCRKRDDVT